jgi:putative copper export protein
MSGVADREMQLTALHSSEGAAFGLRMTGLVLVAAGLRWGWRPVVAMADSGAPAGSGGAVRNGPVVAILGAVLAVAGFTVTGHTSVSPHRATAVALLVLHLLIVAFWIGALWPLYLAPTREQRPVAARLIDAFSRSAAWLVPVILVAGGGLAALLVPDLSAFRQPYGELLLVKVVFFALLMGLAALNKRSFGPACAQGETRAFRRTVVAEYVLICFVLAVTAALTTFYSPEAP